MVRPAPALPGIREADIDTPALLVDLDALEANLDAMALKTQGGAIALRPHAKTHKSAVIAHLQMRRGAVGQCVQKVAEAESLAWGGVGNILVTNQVVDPAKLARLVGLTSICDIMTCADHEAQVSVLEAAAANAGVRLSVLVEIDVGAGRCGAAPGADAAGLAERIARSRHLSFCGLQAYQGSAQHRRTFEERERLIGSAIDSCARTLEALARKRLSCPIVTGGGTGTFELEMKSGVYTEIQPGSYCFMDADYAGNFDEDGRPVDAFKPSLFVLTTVISTPRPGVAVLDAGHKSISIESGLPRVWQHPDMSISRVSDEHARMEYPRDMMRLKIGDKLRLFPGHCDPTVDRFDWYVGMRNGSVESLWPICARGASY